MRRQLKSSVKSKRAATNLRLYQHFESLSSSPVSLDLCTLHAGIPLPN
jgi:hypothetical protein